MKTTLLACLFALALPVCACDTDIVVKHAWARATVPGQPVSGAYFEISAAKPAKLLRVDSPAAGMVEVHEMKLDGGVMKMRALDALPLPAGQTVTLKPGGTHVMLMQLKQPLKVGSKLALTLHVEQAGKTATIQTEAEVRAMTAQ